VDVMSKVVLTQEEIVQAIREFVMKAEPHFSVNDVEFSTSGAVTATVRLTVLGNKPKRVNKKKATATHDFGGIYPPGTK